MNHPTAARPGDEVLFNVNGLALTGKRWGTPGGIPTFALHGWLDNANTFDRLAPVLTELDLIALDFAGHGASDHRPPGVHYQSLANVHDVLAVAEQLGWDRFHLIGHSMGAGIAAELSGLFPEKIMRAVLIDGMLATGGTTDVERVDGNREAVLQMLAAGSRKPPVYQSLNDMAERVTQATDQSFEAASTLVERGHKADESGFTWRTDPRIRFSTPMRMNSSQIAEVVSRTTAPTLLLVAENGDRWYLGELPQRQAEHPNLTVIDIPDGTHHIHLEPRFYQQVRRYVREFLQLDLPEAATE